MSLAVVTTSQNLIVRVCNGNKHNLRRQKMLVATFDRKIDGIFLLLPRYTALRIDFLGSLQIVLWPDPDGSMFV